MHSLPCTADCSLAGTISPIVEAGRKKGRQAARRLAAVVERSDRESERDREGQCVCVRVCKWIWRIIALHAQSCHHFTENTV